MKRQVVVWVLRLGLLAVLVGGWLYANGPGDVSKLLLPDLGAVLSSLGELLRAGDFWASVWRTMYEVLAAFLIAAFLGTLLAFWAARKPLRSKVTETILMWGYMAPLILFYPLFTLSLGLGPASKIGFAAVATVFPLSYGALRAFKSVSATYMQVGRAFGASSSQLDWQIKFRSMRPLLLSSFRIGAAYSIIVVILAEMLASNGGLGYELSLATDTFAPARAFALIIAIMMVVGLIQVALNRVMTTGRSATH